MKKVLLLIGGNSSEHEVSCKSAKSILENIDYEEYVLTSCIIDRNNDWYLYQGNISNIVNWKDETITKVDNIVDLLKSFDIVFPIIHGETGEDGKLQAMLDLFNINYVGSKTTSSAIGMDKEFAKIVFAHAGIPQAKYLTLMNDYSIDKILSEFSFPVIVKPANGGSSIGINKANNEKELLSAINEAKSYDKKVIIEEYIVGRELECAVLDGKELIISSIGEIIPANEFYDYNAKYENDSSQTIVPADLPDSVVNIIKDFSLKAFNAINARGLARVDFFYKEAEGKIYLNEINTLPGFTTISMYPKMIMASGYTYKELLTLLIEGSF